MVKINYNFNEFPSLSYLKDFYDVLGKENQFLMDNYHKAYSKMRKKKIMLEIGGGPTIYQLISASLYVDQIIFSEYSELNRKTIELWQNNAPNAYNWDAYFKYIADLNQSDWVVIKKNLQTKIKKIISCDILKTSFIKEYQHDKFDIVSSNFCAESITNNQDEFYYAMDFILRYLHPQSTLVMTFIREAEYYRVGTEAFPAFPVNEKMLHQYFTSKKIQVEISSVDAEHTESGYTGLIFITGSLN